MRQKNPHKLACFFGRAFEFLIAITLCQTLIGALIVSGYLIAKTRFWILRRWRWESARSDRSTRDNVEGENPLPPRVEPRLLSLKKRSDASDISTSDSRSFWKNNYLFEGIQALIGVD